MRRLLLLCFTALLAPLAHADAIYTYTGQPFVYAQPPYTTSDSVSGFFTLSAPLSPDLSGVYLQPIAFSFSDGVQTRTNRQPGYSEFLVFTNGIGDLTTWIILVGNRYTNSQIAMAGGAEDPYNVGDLGYINGNVATNYVSGVFTETTTTPEPATLALLSTGLLGSIAVVRRRLA